jgi:hypothetical protein
MYPKGVFGNRIIEGKRGNKYYYYSATLELRITAPIKEGKYTFSLQFNNRELWREIKNHLFNNPDCIVVVAGEWKPTSTFNTFRSAITSKKQIYTNAKLRFVERR